MALAHRPWRTRVGSDERLDPNLMPLLDVVLQLVVFLMMLVHFGVRVEGTRRHVDLPQAQARLTGRPPEQAFLSVELARSGQLIVDDGTRVLDDSAASAWWQREALRHQAPGPGASETRVHVRADRGATFAGLRKLLSHAQEAGFAQFSLMVERELR